MLIRIQSDDFFPIRWYVGVRFLALEALVRMPLVAADANVVAKVRRFLRGLLHCQYGESTCHIVG